MSNQPKVFTAPMGLEPKSLYPTMDSLQAVLDLGASRMPINQWNEMHSLLMSYHNTMLKIIRETPCK